MSSSDRRIQDKTISAEEESTQPKEIKKSPLREGLKKNLRIETSERKISDSKLSFIVHFIEDNDMAQKTIRRVIETYRYIFRGKSHAPVMRMNKNVESQLKLLIKYINPETSSEEKTKIADEFMQLRMIVIDNQLRTEEEFQFPLNYQYLHGLKYLMLLLGFLSKDAAQLADVCKQENIQFKPSKVEALRVITQEDIENTQKAYSQDVANCLKEGFDITGASLEKLKIAVEELGLANILPIICSDEQDWNKHDAIACALVIHLYHGANLGKKVSTHNLSIALDHHAKVHPHSRVSGWGWKGKTKTFIKTASQEGFTPKPGGEAQTPLATPTSPKIPTTLTEPSLSELALYSPKKTGTKLIKKKTEEPTSDKLKKPPSPTSS